MQEVASDALVRRLILVGMTQGQPRPDNGLRTPVPTTVDFVHPRCRLTPNHGIHDAIVTLKAVD